MKNIFYALLLVYSLFSCNQKAPEKPNTPPATFEVAAKTEGRNVILEWTEATDPDGDPVTYAVVYGDTLAKGLTQKTFTIKDLPYETEVSGVIVASDGKGGKTERGFKVRTAPRPNSSPESFEVVPFVANGSNEVVLSWSESRDPDGDVIQYSVFYKDTLTRGLTVRSYTIKNLPYNTVISGVVVAKDGKGGFNEQPFSAKTSEQVTGQDHIRIPDTEFERILVQRRVDDVMDGKLLKSRTVGIKELVLESDYIRTLSGIEVFEDLESVVINGRNLEDEKINLSKNTKMWNLQIKRAPKLKSFDVSNFQRLQYLILTHTLIESLDLAKNKRLFSAYCHNNKLKEIDIRDNVELNSLEIYSNSISHFDGSYSSNLKDLGIGDNPLTSLAVNANLRSLSIPGTKLDLSLVEYPNRLETLNLSNNNIQEIDLDLLPKTLSTIALDYNKLKALDFSDFPSLFVLSVSNNNLEEIDVSKNNLSRLVINNNKLKKLDLRNSSLLASFNCLNNQLSVICIHPTVKPGTFWEKDPSAIYKVCD